MRNLLATLVLLFIYPTFAQADDHKRTINPETALNAVQLFKSDPLGPDAEGALAVALNFAEHSDLVTVQVSRKYLPWQFEAVEQKINAKLLGAYISGNLEHQMNNNINKNSPLEGIRLVLHIYQVLRADGQMAENANLETWIALDREGKLAGEIEI